MDGAEELPIDLAAAVVALFDATPALSGAGAFTAICEDQAGDKAVLPYLVLTIARATLDRKTSTSTWHDYRVTLTAWAATGDRADALVDLVRGVFEPEGEGIHLSFRTGVTAPLYEADSSRGKGRSRAPGSEYAYWARVEYSARARLGRP